MHKLIDYIVNNIQLKNLLITYLLIFNFLEIWQAWRI